MIALKKIWIFLKTHWYIPLLVIVGIILKSQNNKTSKIVEAAKESYDKQKEAIESAAKEKTIASKKINEQYNKAITQIEIMYDVQNKKLEAQKKKEIKKIVKQHYNDRDSLGKEISKAAGLIYVPTKNNNSSS